MRSLLFVPAHDARKLAKGLNCGANALILDLEHAVPEAQLPLPRSICAEFVSSNRLRLPLFVRIVDWAKRVALAFDAMPTAGAVSIDAGMLDRPHYRSAKRLLARSA